MPILKAGVESLRLGQNNAQLDQLKSWLSSTDSIAQQSDILRRRHEGTGQWFLDTPKFSDWMHEPNVGATLFCTGIPGAGKTIIAAAAIDHLITKVQSNTTGVAWVYCSYKSRTGQTAVSLFSMLLRQLIHADKPRIVELVEQLKRRHDTQKTRPTADDISNTLGDAISEFSTVHFVIDALDECLADDGTRRHFLNVIRALQMKTDLRVMVTSRHIPEIVHQFSSAPKIEIWAHEKDVKDFLVGQLHQLPKCVQRDADLQKEIHEKIAGAIDGMCVLLSLLHPLGALAYWFRFLLARLYVDSLLDKRTKSKVQITLDALSKESRTLENAYGDAIKRLESQLPGDAALATQVLTWIIYAERALTTSELRHALAVEPGQSALDVDNILDMEDIVSVCAGLVTIDEESDIIRLVHHTTQEYFVSIRKDWNPDGQLDIARTCLTYLSFHAFQSGSCETLDEFETRLKDYPFLDYAARHWGTHAVSVQKDVSGLACAVLLNKNLVSNIVQVVPAYSYEGRYYHPPDPEGRTGLHVIAAYGLRDMAQELLTRYKSEVESWVDKKDSEGRTPLYAAAEHGHGSMVELLIEQGANVNAHGGECDYALSAALSSSMENVVKVLLHYGADIKLVDGNLALVWAFQNYNENLAKLTLEQCAGAADPLIEYNQLPHVAARRGWHEALSLLLDRKPDMSMDALDDRGWTPLYEACHHNHLRVARLLLDKGANPNHADKEGWTPLHITCSRNHVGMTRLLLEKGATPTMCNIFDQTALNSAIYPASLEIVKLLIHHGADVNNMDTEGYTPVCRASRQGNCELVELLLKEGADPNLTNVSGSTWTPLIVASSRGYTKIVKLLLTKGADPNIADRDGWTPLLLASSSDFTEIAKLLLDYGADLSIADTDGWSPLLHALPKGSTELVKLLLHHGADPNIANTKNGSTPLHIATMNDRHEMVNLLLLTKIDMNVTGFSYTPLALLASKGYTELLELSHESYGADLHIVTPHGENLLHVAAKHGQIDTFSFLVDMGLDTLAKDAKGADLLCCAALSNSLALCNAILNMGFVPSIQTEGWTALHWACKKGNVGVIERLVQAGAQSTGVTLPHSLRSWSPMDIAIFHGQEVVLMGLTVSCKAALSSATYGHCDVGQWHSRITCDSCDQVSNHFGTAGQYSRLADHTWTSIYVPHMYRFRLLLHVQAFLRPFT
jgi:ankyrin repeat protein